VDAIIELVQQLGYNMRQKMVSALSVIKDPTQWEESPRKTEVGLSCLWPYDQLKELFEQVFEPTRLGYPNFTWSYHLCPRKKNNTF
jgi:hypothetical protein